MSGSPRLYVWHVSWEGHETRLEARSASAAKYALFRRLYDLGYVGRGQSRECFKRYLDGLPGVWRVA